MEFLDVSASRRQSTLHKMVEAAASGMEGVKWNHVLHYLKAHCQAKDDDDDEDKIEHSSDETNSHSTKSRSNTTKEKKSKSRINADIVILEENPLPEYYIATEELKEELWIDKSKGDSVLRLCLSSAPAKVIAALCFLLPEALRAPDTNDRLALHYACRYPVSERLDGVMKVLIKAHPGSLIYRDDDGRTPLHYLFWYHGNKRTPDVVSLFCQNLLSVKSDFYKLRQPVNQKLPQHSIDPNINKQERKSQQQLIKEKQQQFPLPEIPKPVQNSKIPFNAAIVPDTAHGCLPLHYAVMEGASVDVILILYQAYPQSKHFVDRYGRTPLHWYLGAGTLEMWNGESPLQHVSGEDVPIEPLMNCVTTSSFDRFINYEVVQILLSSRVARTADFQERYPLHWAATFLAHNYALSSNPGFALSLKVVQLLLDNFVGQLICLDKQKMSPAMLMFDTVAKIQLRDWNKNSMLKNIPTFDLVQGGGPDMLFGPPIELMEMLLTHPDPTANANVAALEDASGRLLVHAALEVASSPECIALLIKCHPTALIHTAEETLFVPLHAAFCHKRNAPLQTPEIITLLLQSMQAGRYGTLVDGRLAMKMEDSAGFYPIHYATQNGACLDVIKILVERYPNTALLPTPCGDLPIHCVMTEALILSITNPGIESPMDINDQITQQGSSSATSATESDVAKSWSNRKLEELAVTREKMYILLRPLLSNPIKLAVADEKYGMLPLHCAVLFGAADYSLLLRMLEMSPQSAVKFTKPHENGCNLNVRSCSALDLHEIAKPNVTMVDSSGNMLDAWLRKRELLFSFCPTLESHRHREELLNQCIRAVIDELGEALPNQDINNSNYRYHLRMGQSNVDEKLDLEITHSVSNMEREVLQSFGFKQSRPPRQVTSRPVRKGKKGPSNSNVQNEERLQGRKKPSKRRQKQNSVPKASSSMYDEDNASLGYDTFTEWFEAGEREGDESESLFSGEDTDGQFSSDADDSQDETDTNKEEEDVSDHGSEGEILSGEDASRSFGYTTSGSRLRTTFEEGSGMSEDDDETRSDDDDSRSFTDDTGTRRSFDDDESTLLSRQATLESEGKNAFDTMKESLEAEEKKEDYSVGGNFKASLNTPKTNNNSRRLKIKAKPKRIAFQRPEYISEVAMRIWSFFVLYCDPNNPNDNYVKQVSDIIDEIKFSTVEKLVSVPLPPYAQLYFDAEETEGLTFRDVASPKCRELIHKTCYFVGRYDLNLQQQQQAESKTSILVHRSPDDSSLTIRAIEWLFTTEEVTPSRDAGVAVENIWATGEIPAEIGVTFHSTKRPVWIKFTKDKTSYENEISTREALGLVVEDDKPALSDVQNKSVSGIVPLLAHFNALNTHIKRCRTYNVDINDERFNVVNLFGGDSNSEQFKLHLNKYPYALVYPAPTLGGTLHDYFYQYGIEANNLYASAFIEQSMQICGHITKSVASMHDTGICHCDVSARNLIMHSQETVTSRKNQWSFFAFSKSSFLNKLTSFQGGITSQGYPQFNTSTLPPEMFMKLSPSQLKAYTNYWIFVQEEFSVNIDQSVIEPIVDLRTGDSFVVKCHFIPLTDGSASLEKPMPVIPALPYDLISLQPSTDLWSLGQIIFLLCSGRPLLPFDSGSLRLLDYAAAYDWNPEPSIYEYILDPMAQDVLLTLLAIRSKREKVKLSDLLNHPFFLGQSACSPTLLKQITEKRRVECGAFKREQRKQVNANFEKEWLESRTDNITCWDFEILERIHLSPTEISRGMTARKERFNLPCNFIVLPYKLSMDIALTEEENEHAEQCGEGLLQLSKACYFTSVMKQATSSVVQDESNSHKWSSSEMLRVLDLSSDEFGDIQTEMASFAAKHVEAFRHDPMSVALKLVQTRIRNFLACFEDKPLYLYLIDEFSSLPILDDIFPVLVPDEWRENVLQNGILSMHLCSLHARGVARGIAGLLHLIYNDAETTIPPSLAEIGRGLNHKLDESAFVKEMQLLQAALTDMYGTKHLIYDDISTIHDFLSEIDPYRNLASVRRVVSGGSSLWTTCDGSRILDEISRTLTFKDALRRSRRHSHKLKEYKQKLDTLACEENGEAV